MKVEIFSNGNKYIFYDNFIDCGKQSMIWYKDLQDVYFHIEESGFFSNLLGRQKGYLIIKHKQSAHSNALSSLSIEINKSEFDKVQSLAQALKKIITDERERQRRIAEAIERKKQAERQAKNNFSHLLESLPRISIDLTDEKVLRNNALLSPFSETATITKRTSPKRFKDFIAIDTETTGIRPGGNDIIEVTAIKFENCLPSLVFTTLLKPRNPIPQEASKINGITNEMVENAPSFAQIKSALQSFIGEYPIVAHNAAFDISFLYVSGLEFPEKTIFYDTLSLSKKHIKDSLGEKLDSYKLTDACNACNIFFDNAHRSSADALAAGLLFLEIVKLVKDLDDLDLQ